MTSFQDRILTTEATDPFLWIVVVGALGAFFAAFGIGANDVANAFATSVGAKAITLRQAILYAAVFEVLGALLMGRGVMKTIREGIAEVSLGICTAGFMQARYSYYINNPSTVVSDDLSILAQSIVSLAASMIGCLRR